ncbi:MAG: HD domain-containing protein, partial [Dorea sp.]|nr:HD domain-containing protein [Dorea sp.]
MFCERINVIPKSTYALFPPDGVFPQVKYSTMEEEQMENLRKMLFAMSRDIRVILIKIA